MLVEHRSVRTFTSCQRKNQWGKRSVFHIHNSTIASSLFIFFVFFQKALAGKSFCERALAFVKQISFVVLVQFQYHAKLFLVHLPQNFELYYVLLLRNRHYAALYLRCYFSSFFYFVCIWKASTVGKGILEEELLSTSFLVHYIFFH